jgi:hypothetical protein
VLTSDFLKRRPKQKNDTEINFLTFQNSDEAWTKWTSARKQGCQMPKIPIRVYFGGPWDGKCWYTLWSFGIFYSHLVYVFYGHLV